jgi:hypothetical protein
MPVQYEGIIAEHMAVETLGVFDVVMGEVYVKGRMHFCAESYG